MRCWRLHTPVANTYWYRSGCYNSIWDVLHQRGCVVLLFQGTQQGGRCYRVVRYFFVTTVSLILFQGFTNILTFVRFVFFPWLLLPWYMLGGLCWNRDWSIGYRDCLYIFGNSGGWNLGLAFYLGTDEGLNSGLRYNLAVYTNIRPLRRSHRDASNSLLGVGNSLCKKPGIEQKRTIPHLHTSELTVFLRLTVWTVCWGQYSRRCHSRCGLSTEFATVSYLLQNESSNTVAARYCLLATHHDRNRRLVIFELLLPERASPWG